jgi:hypothetical protein
MSGRASAFATLGLEPGADAAAVDQAYRRLIKQYHPDREGGDGARAAEIIHAYRELRGGKALVDPLQFHDHSSAARRRRHWPLIVMALLLAGGAGAIVMEPELLPQLPAAAGAVRIGGHHHKKNNADAMEQPLHDKAINAAVAEARSLYATKDEFALAGVSRDCQQRFRKDPGVELLDRCAAFDNAVIGLRDRDPLRDGGPFAPLSVTGRQWSAASSLSDDYIAIDSRLDRIRLQVELALAAAQSPSPAAAPAPAASAQRPRTKPGQGRWKSPMHWRRGASGRKHWYRTTRTT